MRSIAACRRPPIEHVSWHDLRRTCGCRLLQDLGGSGVFIVIEEWTSMILLRRHLRGNAYRQMLALMEMSVCPCAVSFHTIRCTVGMELVHQALAKADE